MHQDCSGTSCLQLLHFYPDLEVAVFSKTLVPSTRLQSVISKGTVTLIFIEATTSNVIKLLTCFWYSNCQPSFISGQTMQETGSTHTHTGSDVVKNNELELTRICGSVSKYVDLIPASATHCHYWAHAFQSHLGCGCIRIFQISYQ